MLQGIRDSSKGIVAKVIVGFIVLTFAMFGVDSLVGLTQGSNAPATVNGEEITERDLYQAAQLQRRSILARMGEQADPSSIDDNLLQSMVLESLIEQKALLVEASEHKMRVSEKMVDEAIVNTPEFQVEGRFSPEQFDVAIRNAGFTRFTYRETVKKEQLLRQQRAGFALSSYVMPSNVERIVALDRQTRDIQYFSMPIETVRALTKVSDQEVKDEFEARKDSLKTAEQVSLEYVELNRKDLEGQVDVSAQEIDEQYQQILAGFEAQEQRQVAHILIEVNDDIDDAQALEKAQQLKAQLDAGESFAELAKANSNDFGSAENGGDLGVVEKGAFEPSLDEALFSLAENTVSEPVKSESGYHLVKVLSIEKTQAPSLADSETQIREQLSAEKSEQLYLEKLEKMTDLAFIGGDLAEVSAELDLEIKVLSAFSAEGGNDVLSQNTKVIREAFSDEILKDSLNSAPIELARDHAIVVRLKEHFPVRSQSFAEVEAQLKASLLTDKAAKQLQERAKAAIAEIKESGSAVSSAADFELKKELNVSRVAAQVPGAVVNKAFSLAHPQPGKVTVDSVVLADKSLAIVIVDKVNVAEVSQVTKEEMTAINNALATRLGNQAYQTFVEQTKNAAEVERL